MNKGALKILILGHTGLLGSAIYNHLSSKFECLSPSSFELDVTSEDSVKSYFQLDFDWVINATGYTQVDLAETETEKAYLLNQKAVEILASACRLKQVPIIHFSTDYVFDGTLDRPYLESDLANPINVYGKSKWSGEQSLRQIWDQYYIFRVQWLYGDRSPNFIEQMLNLSKTNQVLRVVSDQWGSPTSVFEIALVINKVLSAIEELEFGTYHLRASGKTNWAGYAREIFKIKEIDIDVQDVGTDAFPRPANRPKNGVLDQGNFNQFHKMAHWADVLAKHLK